MITNQQAMTFALAELHNDLVVHAEILALRDAADFLGRWRFEQCSLVVSLEPCTICAGALVNAHLQTLVLGIFDQKAGATGSFLQVCTNT